VRNGLQARPRAAGMAAVRPVLWAVVCAGVAVMIGCATAPTCDVSPIELEELREDITVQDKDLAGVREREAALKKELATKQADLDAIKPKPDELRKRLEQVKRGSGRVDKPKAPAATEKPAEKKESS